jgi:pimeloyl-ACP methyl ester carboxylesterase
VAGDGIATRRVTANGLEFGVLEAGSGPLVLCLHGFPDTPYTWRHLLPELAGAGFHAVAPFTRGYAPTSIAADGDYTTGALAADANALHEALGGDERAVLIGHDWGAEATFGAAGLAPDRWRRAVVIAGPPDSLNLRVFSDYDQLKRFFYFFFMLAPFAEAVVGADDMAFLERLWADWSPGYDTSEDVAYMKASLREPEHLSAAIGYYRAMTAAEPMDPGPGPYLYLHGDQDVCIAIDMVRDVDEHLPSGSRVEFLAGVGHSPHLERPAEVNELILEWIS